MTTQPELKPTDISSLTSKSDEEINNFFKNWNKSNADQKTFQHVDYFARQEFTKLVAEKAENQEIAATLIETIRLMSRDKVGIETLMTPELCDMVLHNAALPPKNGFQTSTRNIAEAQKCLINTIFNSPKMRERFAFHTDNSEILLGYLTEFTEPKRKNSEKKWVRDMTEAEAGEMWYLYHRIAFIVTALIRPIQTEWSKHAKLTESLVCAVEYILPNKFDAKKLTANDFNRANEALKTLFNVFCHADEHLLDENSLAKINKILKALIVAKEVDIDYDTKQSAINCFAVPPIYPVLTVLCGKDEESNSPEKLDDMEFTENLLVCLEKKLDEIPSDNIHTTSTTNADLIGPYFSALSRLCRDSKFARRYCRLRILPPLKSKEVEKRPEEENSVRGKIVRLMMLPTCAKDIATQFLFILCKKSVSRMIKYTGFGHSAGLLANMGLLGQINEPKRESDSEDSETEEYNSIRDNINPVTGSLFAPDRGSALADMTEEQKEYEAMKLVDAMNKMMDAGVVKPGTIGEDGRLRELSHVLELTKNIPDEEKDSDSD